MDTFFWITTKLLWAVATPDTALLILLVLGVVLLRTRRKIVGLWLVSFSTGILLIFALFPVDQLILRPLEERFPVPTILPEKVDGIITLGGGANTRLTVARGQPALTGAAERLTEFVSLGRRYPKARLVFSGGAGGLTEQEYKESETARRVFKQLELDPNRVLFESDSRNTLENAVNSFELVKPQKGETWLLITSAFHMPRSVGVFRKMGWDVIPYPVDYHTAESLEWSSRFGRLSATGEVSWALREWASLAGYWLTGKTSELFPGPNR